MASSSSRHVGALTSQLYKEGGFTAYRKTEVPSRVPYKAPNETLKTRGVLWALARHSAQWPLASFKTYKYCIIVLSYTIVSAKLSALKYFYLFVLGSINIYIYKHAVTVLYILSSLKAMYAVNVLVFRMTNNK